MDEQVVHAGSRFLHERFSSMLNFRNKNRFFEELHIFLILSKIWLDYEII